MQALPFLVILTTKRVVQNASLSDLSIFSDAKRYSEGVLK
jgi:hypothetical protein